MGSEKIQGEMLMETCRTKSVHAPLSATFSFNSTADVSLLKQRKHSVEERRGKKV